MRTSVAAVLLFLVVMAAYPQEKTKTSVAPTQNTHTLILQQDKIIADLTLRIQVLEQRIQSIEMSEQQKVPVAQPPKADISEAKSELSEFEKGCDYDMKQAFAYDVVMGRPLEASGAMGAAMNCTQRLKNAVQKLVNALDK